MTSRTAALLFCLLVGLAGVARAASLQITSPQGRLALPGAYVTFVFSVQSDTSGQASVSVTSQHDYQLLEPPATIALNAGIAVPVPVTVHLPPDAPALTVDEVTLTVSLSTEQAQGTVRVTVGEKRGVAIEAHGPVPLSAGAIKLTLVNEGNVQEQTTLRVALGDKIILSKPEILGPSARQPVDVKVAATGYYEAALLVGGSVQTRTYVRVVHEGIPPPPPLLLHAEVEGAIDTGMSWGFGVKIKGQLSDYVAAEGTFSADQPYTSYLDLRASHWRATIGSASGGGFGVSVASGLGLEGAYLSGPWTVGGAGTWISGDSFAGYVFGGHMHGHDTLGGAIGVYAGTPLLSLRFHRRAGTNAWSGSVDWRQGAADATLRVKARDPVTKGTASFDVQATQLMTRSSAVQFSAGYGDGEATLYGSVAVPFASGNAVAARGGMILTLPVVLPGSLSLALQGSTDTSFATLAYGAVLPAGWQTSEHLGVTGGSDGFGVRAATSWAYVAGATNTLGADVDLTYYPASRSLSGQIGARYAAGIGPAAVTLNGGWDLGQSTVGVGGALAWSHEGWSLQASANGSYDTSTGSFTGQLGLSGAVSTDLMVPESIIDLAGGRRLGKLIGTVRAGEQGLPGITIIVGGHKTRTQANGSFSATLPPGKVRVSLDLTTLPIQYQVQGPLERDVAIIAHHATQADYKLTITAGLRGRVLIDSNGDGSPDSPPKPGSGTVLLTSSGNPPRALHVAPNGTFEARGLTPGPANIELGGLPLGTSVEGSASKTIRLTAGEVTAVTFLVEPATVSAPVFSAHSFRIRTVKTEVNRVPPGSSPLITVHIEGHADKVSVVVSGTSVTLKNSGDTWTGRIPVPLHETIGVLPFQVLAVAAKATSERQGQLLVDPKAPVVEARVRQAAHPGGTIIVELTAYVGASRVTVASPFGPTVEAHRAAPGRWRAHVPVPGSAGNRVFTAKYEVATVDGRVLRGSVKFRVLGP